MLKNVYRVTVFGKDVEFTQDLKEAEYAFKDSRGQVQLWSVSPSGSATLLKVRV